MEFIWWLHPRWVLATLQTVTRDHGGLERITLIMTSWQGLSANHYIMLAVEETVRYGWSELDRLLVQLCESHSIRLEIGHNLIRDPDGSKERSRMKVLLPEVMTKCTVDLFAYKL